MHSGILHACSRIMCWHWLAGIGDLSLSPSPGCSCSSHLVAGQSDDGAEAQRPLTREIQQGIDQYLPDVSEAAGPSQAAPPWQLPGPADLGAQLGPASIARLINRFTSDVQAPMQGAKKRSASQSGARERAAVALPLPTRASHQRAATQPRRSLSV